MPNSFKRFFVFTFCGMLGLTLWAALFGAVSASGAYFWVITISPQRHNSFFAMVFDLVSAMISIVLPLGFVLFGGAFFLTPRLETGARQPLKLLLRLCLIRSLMGTIFLALVSLSISALSPANFTRSGDGIAPPYFYNLVVGWALGFFLGILWGVVEGVLQLRKTDLQPQAKLAAPPIAAP